jgi:hypothetical protein
MKARILTFLVLSALLSAACSRKDTPVDPTGLKPRMTKAQVIEIMGEPHSIKPAGDNKEIYIYREQTELIHVFLVKDRIKNIEHLRRRPPTIYR